MAGRVQPKGHGRCMPRRLRHAPLPPLPPCRRWPLDVAVSEARSKPRASPDGLAAWAERQVLEFQQVVAEGLTQDQQEHAKRQQLYQVQGGGAGAGQGRSGAAAARTRCWRSRPPNCASPAARCSSPCVCVQVCKTGSDAAVEQLGSDRLRAAALGVTARLSKGRLHRVGACLPNAWLCFVPCLTLPSRLVGGAPACSLAAAGEVSDLT